MSEVLGGIGAIGLFLLVFFLLLLCILWIVLPFAVFGIKDRLNRLLEETRLQNELLTEVRDILKRVG